MTKYWIIIAKRDGQTIEIARNYINEYNIWDFVSNNNKNIKPNNASQLYPGDRVLFYLAEKDRNGFRLGRNSQGIILYPFPIFFARATLNSKFIDVPDKDKDGKEINNFVRLKEVKPFKNPIQVIRPKDDYGIGAKGPTMLVEIKDYQYEKVCTDVGVVP